MIERIKPGAEVDSYCTKCKMITNHRVVALVDGVIKRVICLTCDGQHNFRPPPGQKRPKAASARRVTKDKKRVRTSASRTFEHWVDLKGTLDPENQVRAYRMTEGYANGEAFQHPSFGLGFVIKPIGSNKMEVMFETEIKTLAMNRPA